MAAVTVSFDGTRLSNTDATTGWSNEGANPTQETDYYYQGTACVSVQVKTGELGTYYTHGTTFNFSANNMVWLAKIIQTNKDAIDGLGLQLKIGSANSAAYRYEIYSATTYPAVGGWQTVVINPNISQWRTATIGSPDLTAVDVYGIRSDAAFQAKAPNLGIDAVDVMETGEGLTLTRGDSTDANGTFTDFVTTDEGTQANRWAVVQTRGGIIYVNGKLKIGNTSVNTEFTDTNRVLVFPDHLVSNNFCGVDVDASNTGSNCQITSCIFNGRGALTGSDDTRPSYTMTGTAGTIKFDSCTFNTFQNMDLTSATELDGCALLNGLQVTQNSANIFSATVTSPTNLINTGFIISDDPSQLDNLTIEMGSGGGHAIEITSNGTYTLTGHSYTGYSSSNGQSNSVIYNNSTGDVTLNIVGGDVPTIRNGTNANTTVTASVNITVTGLQDTTEVRVFEQGTTTVVAGTEDATAGSPGNRSFTFSTSASTALDIRIINKEYEYLLVQYTTTGDANQTLPVQQRFDRNYANP